MFDYDPDFLKFCSRPLQAHLGIAGPNRIRPDVIGTLPNVGRPVPGKWGVSASGLKRAFGSDCGFIYFLRLLITTRRSQSRTRVEPADRGARLSRKIKCENVDKLIVSAELAGNMGSR